MLARDVKGGAPAAEPVQDAAEAWGNLNLESDNIAEEIRMQ